MVRKGLVIITTLLVALAGVTIASAQDAWPSFDKQQPLATPTFTSPPPTPTAALATQAAPTVSWVMWIGLLSIVVIVLVVLLTRRPKTS